MTAVLLFIVSSLSMQVLDGGEISLAYEHSKKANYYADACAEFVLLKLSNAADYNGSDSPLDIDEDTNDDCLFEITTEVDESKIILIRSQVGDNFYTAESEIVVATTTPSIEITSWDKNADWE